MGQDASSIPGQPPVPDAGPPKEPLIPPEGGPGLEPSPKPDPVAWTAAIFGLLGLVPERAFGGLPNAGHFGPFSVAVLAAIVAVLFAVISIMRYVDLRDRRILVVGLVGGGLGLVRLFIYPLVGL